MKILHLFADWKWTGPAEPVADLCFALQRRGHEVTLAYRRAPYSSPKSVQKGVQERGIRSIDRFHLEPIAKAHHLIRLKDIASDIGGIARLIDEEGIDIVNVHTSHDHIVGGIAARKARRRPSVVRMDHRMGSLKGDPLSRWFFRRYTDGIVTFSQKNWVRLVERLGFPSDRVVKVTTAVDLARFDPRKVYRDMRRVFEIPPDAMVIGIVARFQRYRRTDILLEAVALLVKEFPLARLILVGQSSQMQRSVIEPMEQLGISSHVVLAGYRMDDYIDTLACMDVFCLLTPGSDGTARALREAMAMGKPAVVTKKGILPELVEDGVSGFVVEEEPRAIYRALLRLAHDENLRKGMGVAAMEQARRVFRLERQAEEVEAFYEKILKGD